MDIGGATMPALWRKDEGEQRSAASAGFDHALTREVLRTELVRVRALIATAACLLVVFWTVDLVAPEALNRIWHSFRRSRRRQYRFAPAQGIHRDRRHRELRGQA
jgi:hypothetical protein